MNIRYDDQPKELSYGFKEHRIYVDMDPDENDFEAGFKEIIPQLPAGDRATVNFIRKDSKGSSRYYEYAVRQGHYISKSDSAKYWNSLEGSRVHTDDFRLLRDHLWEEAEIREKGKFILSHHPLLKTFDYEPKNRALPLTSQELGEMTKGSMRFLLEYAGYRLFDCRVKEDHTTAHYGFIYRQDDITVRVDFNTFYEVLARALTALNEHDTMDFMKTMKLLFDGGIEYQFMDEPVVRLMPGDQVTVYRDYNNERDAEGDAEVVQLHYKDGDYSDRKSYILCTVKFIDGQITKRWVTLGGYIH